MNTHKNARLTYLRRLEMVQDITAGGLSPSESAAKQGVGAVTARKWLGRYLADGAAGLLDKSSRPEKSPRARRISPHTWACPKPPESTRDPPQWAIFS
jgi:transposase